MALNKISKISFLKDVMICALGAYGGPEAHYGVFMDQLVTKKKYLTEEALAELIALTAILPGPSSTQTIIAIGNKVGGPLLAFLTLIVWALPAILVMTLFSFLFLIFNQFEVSTDLLRFISPMAVGFIVVAAYKIGKKVIGNYLTIALFIIAIVTTYFIRTLWIFPTLLIFGGFVSIIASKRKNIWNKITLRPPWRYFIIFTFIGIVSFILAQQFDITLLFLFDRFYRYGYLVIGGGSVVIPYMYTDLVYTYQLMDSEAFLIGLGLVQGIPGPMFSFSAYAGGLATSNGSSLYQALGALITGFAIFLPGTLLIFFVLPIWEQLKSIEAIQIALKGITAVAGGLISSTAIIIMQSSGFEFMNVIVLMFSILLLLSKKVPAPVIVLLVILLGIIL